jgi:hypothetical protein
LEPVLAVSIGPLFSREKLDFCSRTASGNLSPPGIFPNQLLPKRVSDEQERFSSLAGKVSNLLSHLNKLSRRAPCQAAILQHLLSVSGPCAEKDLRDKLGLVREALDRS